MTYTIQRNKTAGLRFYFTNINRKNRIEKQCKKYNTNVKNVSVKNALYIDR